MQDSLEILIYSLSDKQKASFAGLTCEKLYPLYRAFSQATTWGSPAVFARGIELLYSSALGEFHQQAAKELLAELKPVTPGLHEFKERLTSYSLDACSALEQGLLFLTDKQETHIVYCATAATDTVEMFVQEYLGLDDSRRDFDKVVHNDPFMRAEVARQQRIIDALLSLEPIGDDDISELRRLNGAAGIVDLGLL